MDFLGFAEAIEENDTSRIEKLTKLLIALSDSQRSFAIQGARREDGAYQLSFNPNITSFSDHVVISFPMSIGDDPFLAQHHSSIVATFWMDACLGHFQKLVAHVARLAFDFDMLIRGGITFGGLFHQDRVVVGPAMIEAYRLESRVAKYPRVVISPELLRWLPDKERPRWLVLDEDGVWHLDYFKLMLAEAGNFASVRDWNEMCVRRIEFVEATLTNRGKHEAAAKWKRLGTYVRQSQ